MANSAPEGRLHPEACLKIARARGGLANLSDLELELMCLAEFEISALSGEMPCTLLREMEMAVNSRSSRIRKELLPTTRAVLHTWPKWPQSSLLP